MAGTSSIADTDDYIDDDEIMSSSPTEIEAEEEGRAHEEENNGHSVVATGTTDNTSSSGSDSDDQNSRGATTTSIVSGSAVDVDDYIDGRYDDAQDDNNAGPSVSPEGSIEEQPPDSKPDGTRRPNLARERAAEQFQLEEGEERKEQEEELEEEDDKLLTMELVQFRRMSFCDTISSVSGLSLETMESITEESQEEIARENGDSDNNKANNNNRRGLFSRMASRRRPRLARSASLGGGGWVRKQQESADDDDGEGRSKSIRRIKSIKRGSSARALSVGGGWGRRSASEKKETTPGPSLDETTPEEEDDDDEEEEEEEGVVPSHGEGDKVGHVDIPQNTELRRLSRSASEASIATGKGIATAALEEEDHVDEDELRDTVATQSRRGEEHYDDEDYAVARACFGDAKFALLIVAGLPGRSSRVKFGDRIDLAFLSERIADCQVQKFSAAREFSEEDFLHINYRQASNMVAKIKATLEAEIESSENADEIDGLEDLSNEASLSLARIFSKQGCVNARLGKHSLALDMFWDSLAAWEKAADEKLRGPKCDTHDPLVLRTHDAIGSSRVSHGVRLLKNTTHPKALLTALQLASSRHALGVEAAAAEDPKQAEIAIHHHLRALELARETERLQKAFDVSLLAIVGSGRNGSAMKFVGAATGVASGGRRLATATHARDVSRLMTQRDPKDTSENDGQFAKQCALLVAQQQFCISHACFRVGLKMLSKKWLSAAIATANELGLSDTKKEAEVAIYIISVMAKHAIASEEKSNRGKSFLLYQGGLPAFVEHKEEPRMLLHFAMAMLEEGSHAYAKKIFNQATKICNAPNPPDHYREVLDALNAQIIIELKEGSMAKAKREMNRRLNIVTYWLNSSSLERAKDLHRLGCFYSLLGQHDKCAKRLEESLRIGSNHDEYDILDSTKFLAATYGAMNAIDAAKTEYELALRMEKDFTNKARLMNALSHLYSRIEGQSHLAAEYFEMSLEFQQENATCGDSSLIIETIRLYLDAMASQTSFTQAIHWYESALNSNPGENPAETSNFKAWCNKGATFFRNGHMNAAGRAFKTILDEVENNSAAPSGATFIFAAMGKCYFTNKDYDVACRQFKKALSLKNDDLSPYQRAAMVCNIATVYYRMANYEESENHLKEALSIIEISDVESSYVKASIMCRVAYALYKRNLFRPAYKMYTEAALMGEGDEFDNEFIIRCNGYAETCRLKLVEQKNSIAFPARKQNVVARKPRLQSSLIPLTFGQNATINGEIYSRERKLLAALGVELGDCHLIALPSNDTKVVCDIALNYLLEQTEDSRTEYVLEFEELLGEQMNSKFVTMKSLLDDKVYHT